MSIRLLNKRTRVHLKQNDTQSYLVRQQSFAKDAIQSIINIHCLVDFLKGRTKRYKLQKTGQQKWYSLIDRTRFCVKYYGSFAAFNSNFIDMDQGKKIYGARLDYITVTTSSFRKN